MMVVQDLVVRRGGRTVLDHLDATFAAGQVCCIVGPNGAGKSTLLEAMSGAFAVDAGRVSIGDVDMASLEPRLRARQVAVVTQGSEPPFAFDVEAVVRMGRFAHSGGVQDDDKWVRRAIDAVHLNHLRSVPVEALSGGERKRVQIARLLAQLSWGETGKLALFDEPTEALDLRHQHLVMGYARMLATHGLIVVVVQHDLTLLSRYADRVIVLDQGRIVADGSHEVLSSSLLSDVFGVDATVCNTEEGRPWIVVRGLSR